MDLKRIRVDGDTVARGLADPNWVVVDARSSDAFIGWRLDNEPSEGHIKGATDFSAGWLSTAHGVSPRELDEWLAAKRAFRGITPEKEVIVYDYTGNEAPAVCEYLSGVGVERLHYFPLGEWTGNMKYYPGYIGLLPPVRLKELIEGRSPSFYTGNDYRLLEVSWGKASEAFLQGHIPGSVHVDSEEFEIGPEWVRVSDEALKQFACNNGITVDTTVVIYGMDRLNTSAAAKLAVVLDYMGVRQVCLLNGGFSRWLEKGYPLERGENPKRSVPSFGGFVPTNPSALVDIDEAKRMVSDPSLGQLIDIRRWECYIGEETGYSYVPKAGRIPNTIWCHDPYNCMNPDGTMENAEELVAWWRENGVDPNRRMAFFCGSASWGAALIEWFGRIAGYWNATIYEGGWCQWQLDPNNPYETGVPEWITEH